MVIDSIALVVASLALVVGFASLIISRRTKKTLGEVIVEEEQENPDNPLMNPKLGLEQPAQQLIPPPPTPAPTKPVEPEQLNKPATTKELAQTSQEIVDRLDIKEKMAEIELKILELKGLLNQM